MPKVLLLVPSLALRSVFLQVGQNIVHPSASRDAVLSHRSHQHLDDLFFAHSSSFDQTGYHPHIADCRRVQPNPIALQLRSTQALRIVTVPRFFVVSLAALTLSLSLSFFTDVASETTLD